MTLLPRIALSRIAQRWPSSWPLQPLPPHAWARQRPTYAAADPKLIQAALERARARPSGNWFVLAAARDVRSDRPFGTTVGGTELVAWRDTTGAVRVGPGACPHLGAPLALAAVDCGELVCRWHGLRLGARSGPGWPLHPAHDDGVLVWARLDELGGEDPTDAPVVPARPAGPTLDAVTTLTGTCEPEDIVANRLDPWHGAWFHPYSFQRLDVLSAPGSGAEVTDVAEADDRFLVTVTFKVGPGLGVPVRAEFVCPEPRTVVMRIVDGEGVGSVVETHATPRGPGPDGRPRTSVVEAVVAGSERPGFAVASRLAPALRPAMAAAATRLWRDDLDYAERRYLMRTR